MLRQLFAGAAFALAATAALAQAYPSKPITFVVPFGAGGDSDLSGRNLAQFAPKYLNGASIIVVGVCMSPDTIEPSFDVLKEFALRFVFAYTVPEFVEATKMIEANPSKFAPLVTGHATLDGVTGAFDALEKGGSQAKLLISPD